MHRGKHRVEVIFPNSKPWFSYDDRDSWIRSCRVEIDLNKQGRGKGVKSAL